MCLRHHSALGTSSDTREPMAEPVNENLRDRPCPNASHGRRGARPRSANPFDQSPLPFSEVGDFGVDEGGFLHGNVADVQYGNAIVPRSVTLLDEAPETPVPWL